VAAAVRFHRTGGPDVLVVDDVPPPEPGPGQVRLAVVAAGVNPVECRIRRGEVPVAGPGPWGLGTDVAGVVDAVGPLGAPHVACLLGAGGAAGVPGGGGAVGEGGSPYVACLLDAGGAAGAAGVSGAGGVAVGAEGVAGAAGAGGAAFAVGDAAFGRALGGAYAEYALADVADLLPKPASLAWDVAASVAISGETAYRTLGLLGVTGLGGTLLVHGASGGVGALAVQLAVLGGARVIGTAGPSSLGRVRGLGADPVAYGPGWAERVRALAPDGVDAVLDTAGAGVLGESVALAGGPERVVTIADRRRAAEHGVTYSRGLVARVPMAEVFAELLPALVDGRVAVHVAHRLPLSEAAQAHRISEAGHPGGRIVLTARATPRCT